MLIDEIASKPITPSDMFAWDVGRKAKFYNRKPVKRTLSLPAPVYAPKRVVFVRPKVNQDWLNTIPIALKIAHQRAEYPKAFNKSKKGLLSLQIILNQVCEKYQISKNEIESSSRVRAIVIPRHEYFYRAKEETKASLKQIGKVVDCDHTSVLNGWKRHGERMEAGLV